MEKFQNITVHKHFKQEETRISRCQHFQSALFFVCLLLFYIFLRNALNNISQFIGEYC